MESNAAKHSDPVTPQPIFCTCQAVLDGKPHHPYCAISMYKRLTALEEAASAAICSWDGGTILKDNNRRYRTVAAEKFDALRELIK